jgi:hypothetical protein
MVSWLVMPTANRTSHVLAVLCLGSFAGALHAEETGLRPIAVAALPNVAVSDRSAATRTAPPSSISEGDDLHLQPGVRRSTSSAAARLHKLLPNPYGPAQYDDSDSSRSTRVFEAQRETKFSDDRWSNPYVLARRVVIDDRWSNPYARADARAVGDSWSNPYSAPVRQ